MKKPKMVSILWVDSAHPRGWQRLDEYDGPSVMHCLSIGLLIRETDEAVSVASAMVVDEGQEQASGIIEIPKLAIVNMKRIKEK